MLVRRAAFARRVRSAIGALDIRMTGHVICHLLTAAHAGRAPGPGRGAMPPEGVTKFDPPCQLAVRAARVDSDRLPVG